MPTKAHASFLLCGAFILLLLSRPLTPAGDKSLVRTHVPPSNSETNMVREISYPIGKSPNNPNSPLALSPSAPVEEDLPPSLPALRFDDNLVETVNSGSTQNDQIALTFDDGPHPTLTPKILEELRGKKIHATFFVLGSLVKRYPAIVHQIVAEGHQIGNHTYDHKLLTRLPTEKVEQEIIETHNEIIKATGMETFLFRPPYGSLRSNTKLLLYNKNYKVVLWSVDPMDWKVRDKDQIISRILSKTRRGSIILCHDINQATFEALPSLLDQLQLQGYKFVTVNELCDLPVMKPAPLPSAALSLIK